MNLTEVKLAMAAAWAAGYDQDVPTGWLPNSAPPLYMKRKSLEGYIFSNPTHVIVAFQGTEIAEYSDILTDLDFRKVDILTLPGKWHRGFAFGAGRFWIELLVWLKHNLGQRKLIITGFSLGAALAQVISVHLTKADFQHTVYAFGGPRVATARAGQWLASKAEHYRIHTYDDWVPHLPPFFFGFKHFGSLGVITSKGTLVTGARAGWLAWVYSVRARKDLGHNRLRYLLLIRHL